MHDGISYFPLDVHLDDKIRLIEAEFGLSGFAIIVKLYQKIYGVCGYYCEWTEDVALLFSGDNKLGGNVASEIVSAAIRRGIFSQELFEKYCILTSTGIQKHYFEIVKRRKNVGAKKEYLLFDVALEYKNVNILDGNVNNLTQNVNNNPQSKVKESKVNESKVNDEPHPSKKHKYGELENVLLTEDELEKLKTTYSDYEDRINRLSLYISSSGKIYKSHYATVLSWARKDSEIGRGKNNTTNPDLYDYDTITKKAAQKMADKMGVKK